MKKIITIFMAILLILSSQNIFATNKTDDVDAVTSVTYEPTVLKTDILGNYLGYMGDNEERIGVLIKIYQDNKKDKALVNTYPVPGGKIVDSSKFICDVFKKADLSIEIYGKDILLMDSKSSLINFIGRLENNIFKGNANYIKDAENMLPFKLIKETKETGPSSWAQSQIYSTISDGYVPLKLQENFYENINRRDFIHLIMNCILKAKDMDIDEFIDKEKLEIESYFKDISDDKLILAAYDMNIIKGYGNEQFGPDDYLTREQAAVILSNAIYYFKIEHKEREFNYKDQENISNWAKRDVKLVSQIEDPISKNNLMEGVKDKDQIIFAPLGNLTIEQAIIISARLKGILKN
ncbi:MAG: S-layer homology domain-containing protein [Tissierellia bacterium]|nr:S-layer homology domain-containing protein [Tissierellia bacterium]